MFADYQCEDCEELCMETHRTKDGEDIPDELTMGCQKGKSDKIMCNFKRFYGGRVYFDIGEGKHGNAANKYTSNPSGVYKASALTPTNKIPGRKKSDSVLSDKSMW